MTLNSSTTCKPGTPAPRRLPSRPPPPRDAEFVFWVMTRTRVGGSDCSAYCSSGWIFSFESRLTTDGGGVLASAPVVPRLVPSNTDARIGATSFWSVRKEGKAVSNESHSHREVDLNGSL